MELTLATLRESLIDDDLDRYRTIVETLTDEFDLVEIALAAVKLAHEAVGGDEDETEIPEIAPRKQSGNYEDRGKPGKSFKDGKPSKDGKGGKFGKEGKGPKGDKGERLSKGDAVRLYFPIGRSAHVRPGDLVGAIAGETSLSGKDIGAIEITENFSLVEVPGKSVEEVIGAMKRTTIKGLKITPRRERF